MDKRILIAIGVTALAGMAVAYEFKKTVDNVSEAASKKKKRILEYTDESDHLFYLNGMPTQPVISIYRCGDNLYSIKYFATESNDEGENAIYIKHRICSDLDCIRNLENDFTYGQLKEMLACQPEERYNKFVNDFTKEQNVYISEADPDDYDAIAGITDPKE